MLDFVWSVRIESPEVDSWVGWDETLETIEGIVFIAHGERIV